MVVPIILRKVREAVGASGLCGRVPDRRRGEWVEVVFEGVP